MWFKKKSVLQADGHYDTEKSADGTTDLRTTYKDYANYSSSIINSGRPSAADAGNYFYLPALGVYGDGFMTGVGDSGSYWSSSAYPRMHGSAYSLRIYGGTVTMSLTLRDNGCRVDWPE